MVEIIGYVALALGFIAVIVSNVVAAQKKKQQLMERTNNYEKEFEESKYQENVLTYTFVRLKKDYDKLPTNRFFKIFFDALQTFPEDSKLRKAFSDVKDPNGIGSIVLPMSMMVEITGRKGFMNDWHIKLKNYFNFSENEIAKLESLMDADAKALVEKVFENL